MTRPSHRLSLPARFALVALAMSLLSAPALPGAQLPVGNIDTVAGGNRWIGDGGQADEASLRTPGGLGLDGNILYLADRLNRRIAAVDLGTGVITTVAGTGTRGFAGDSGEATAAELDNPGGVEVADGVLYIADFANHRVRAVDLQTGIITTVAGDGGSSHAGDDGLATEASVERPESIAVADGQLYIASSFERRVRVIDLTTGIITTFAGTGERCSCDDDVAADEANLERPYGVAVSGGMLYIADRGDDRVRAVDLESKIITTVAGTGSAGFSGDGGPAVDARLRNPEDVTVADGVLYIAEPGNNRIRAVDLDSGVIDTLAGTGGPLDFGFSGDGGLATEAQLWGPRETVVHDGTLLIADRNNHRVRAVDLGTNIITTLAGIGETPSFFGEGVAAKDALLDYPKGIAADADGGYYFADAFNLRVRHVDALGIITTIAGIGASDTAVPGPAVDSPLGYPTDVAVGSDGTLYIADCDSPGQVLAVAQGTLEVAAEGLSCPYGVDIGPDGTVYIANDDEIATIDGDGTLATLPGGTGFGWVSSVAVAPDGAVYAAECGDTVHRITGGLTAVFAGGNGSGYSGDGGPAEAAQLNCPYGLATGSDGSVYIADGSNRVVRKVDPDGIISTLAGMAGDSGFSGDGGPATKAQLSWVSNVTLTSDERQLLIGDSSNDRIRVVQLLEPPPPPDEPDDDGPGAPSTPGPDPAPAPSPAASVQRDASAGETVSTLPEGTALSLEVPAAAAVTTPNAGSVSVVVEPVPDDADPPVGFTLLGSQVVISAPPATPEAPLVLGFFLDTSALDGVDPELVVPLREGVPVPDCADAAGTTADPDPCVGARSVGDDGVLALDVRTSAASTWTFGVAEPVAVEACTGPLFGDVAAGSAHADAIGCAVLQGIAQGYPDGAFRPGEPVRRDQLASFVARALTAAGHELPAAEHRFGDLAGNVHADAVGRLAAAGIVAGATPATFIPAQPVRRDQAAAVLIRALDWAGAWVPPGGAGYFTDTAGNVHADAIDAAFELGLATGVTPAVYAPGLPVRRDQLTTLLVRLQDSL